MSQSAQGVLYAFFLAQLNEVVSTLKAHRHFSKRTCDGRLAAGFGDFTGVDLLGYFLIGTALGCKT